MASKYKRAPTMTTLKVNVVTEHKRKFDQIIDWLQTQPDYEGYTDTDLMYAVFDGFFGGNSTLMQDYRAAQKQDSPPKFTRSELVSKELDKQAG